MSSHPVLEMHLRELRLPAIRSNYLRLAKDGKSLVSYLGDLVALEMTTRNENATKARMSAARFPSIKTFDTFDFSNQPDIPKMRILELASTAFVNDKQNAIFYGPPGTGKTHCLIAIGIAACLNGKRTYFATAAGLLNSLLDAKRDGTLGRKLRVLARYELLLIDELGYIPFEREATDLLFQVISQRYESGSVALTTNLAFEQWTQVFPDAMTASAVIDRLIHHGSVFEFKGESHRLRSRDGNGRRMTKR